MKRSIFLLFVLLIICTFSASLMAQDTPTPLNPNNTSMSNKVPATVRPLFWDLAVDHFIINGQNFPFVNDCSQAKVFNLKVGDSVSCQCFYKIRTINLGEITNADAAYWGTGNFMYKIAGGLFFPGPPSNQEYKIEDRKLPKFTYADVQVWKTSLGASSKKEWTESLTYNWTAKSEHVGKTMYLHFDVDSFLAIKETDEQNNGSFSGSGLVAKFIIHKIAIRPGMFSPHIEITKWDVGGGNFFQPNARIEGKVYAINVQIVRLVFYEGTNKKEAARIVPICNGESFTFDKTYDRLHTTDIAVEALDISQKFIVDYKKKPQ